MIWEQCFRFTAFYKKGETLKSATDKRIGAGLEIYALLSNQATKTVLHSPKGINQYLSRVSVCVMSKPEYDCSSSSPTFFRDQELQLD